MTLGIYPPPQPIAGAAGAAGTNGATGATGPQGDPGATGATGSAGAPGAATIITQDEGVVVDSLATVLNFIGAGVTVNDAGGGITTINIPSGGGSDSAEGIRIRYLLFGGL